MTLRVFETTARSVLTRSKIPGLDYAVNPYVGCAHACSYCYATFMKKFLKIPDPWGEFVGVKANAAEVLLSEVARRPPGVVSFGTVCDPYQEIERERRLTRACLEVFVDAPAFDVGVLTKSDLVLRDADVLLKLASVEVGFTVTTLEPDVAAVLEPGAPSPARRLAAMKGLAEQGVGVWGFLGPLLPGVSDSEEAIGEILASMKDAGVSCVLVDRMNLYPKVVARLTPVLKASLPETLPVLDAVRDDPGGYERVLRARVRSASNRAGVDVEACF
jgi:DNA repair photolyase